MNQQMSERESTQVPQTGAFHTFSLKPLPFSGSCLVDFQVDFSPRKNSESSSVSTLPSFNSDGKHFTPAFHLNAELNQEQHWEQNFFRNFENKKNQYTLQNKHLLQPKPESRYCQVCHQYFQDYLKHTKHPVHVKKLREGTVEAQITQLIQYFKNSGKSFKRNAPIDDHLDAKSLDPNCDCFEEGLTHKKKIKTQNIDNDKSELFSTIGSLNHLVIQSNDDLLSEL